MMLSTALIPTSVEADFDSVNRNRAELIPCRLAFLEDSSIVGWMYYECWRPVVVGFIEVL